MAAPAIALQAGGNINTTGGGVQDCEATLTTTTGKGAIFIVTTQGSNAAPTGTISDNKTGNTWTLAGTLKGTSGWNQTSAIWYCENITNGGSGHTIHFAGTNTYPSCYFIQFDCPIALDNVTTVDAPGTGALTGSLVCAANTFVCVSVGFAPTSAGTWTLSDSTNGFTSINSLPIPGDGGDWDIGFLWKTRTTSGTQNVSITGDIDTSTNQPLVIASFTNTSGGGPTLLTLSASLGKSPVFIRSVGKSPTATANKAPVFSRSVSKTTTGTAGKTPTFTRNIPRSYSGTLSKTASFIRGIIKGALSTTVGKTASVTSARVFLQNLTASLGKNVSIARHITRNISVSKAVSATATPLRSLFRTISASVATSGVYAGIKLIARSFSATAGATASALRSYPRLIAATVASATTMIRSIPRTYSTTENVFGSYAKGFFRTFSATKALTATNGWIKLIARSFTASVGNTPTLVRRVGKAINGTTSIVPTFIRNFPKTLSATVGKIPTAGKAFLRELTATLGKTATFTRLPNKIATVSIATTASLSRRVSLFLSSATSAIANVIANGLSVTNLVITATIGKTASISRTAGKNAIGTVGKLASYTIVRARIFTATIGTVANRSQLIQKVISVSSALNNSVTRHITKVFSKATFVSAFVFVASLGGNVDYRVVVKTLKSVVIDKPTKTIVKFKNQIKSIVVK